MNLNNSEKSLYVIIDYSTNEVIAISFSYDVLIKYISYSPGKCKKWVVQERVKKKQIEEFISRYQDEMLIDYNGIIIKECDYSIIDTMVKDEKVNIFTTLQGMLRIYDWDMKPKEKEKINDAILVLYKYLLNEMKMIDKSKIKALCSDREFMRVMKEIEKH